MIFHDKVTVWIQGVTGTDPLGNPTYGYTSHTVPAIVWPLDSSEAVQQGAETVTSRYRMVLRAGVVAIPANGSIKLSWGPHQFSQAVPGSGLEVDGAVESHYKRGRLHHYELTTADVSG